MSLMINNRDNVIRYESEIFASARVKNKPDECLNLGCGARILEGFTNIDKYYISPFVKNYDMYQLPYEDNTINLIFSAQSLEHLPIRYAKMALMDWYRVLKPNGLLVLMVPDLNNIMTKLLDEEYLSDNQYNWYLYTLFGYQINSGIRDTKLNHPVDPGQFHTCGFSKYKLTNELNSIGYKINKMFSFDGMDTPSIFVEATK